MMETLLAIPVVILREDNTNQLKDKQKDILLEEFLRNLSYQNYHRNVT